MTAKNKNPWFACYQPRSQCRLRLFCFPYAGGAASAFRTWTKDIPEDIEICPVQLPGRETRFSEPAFTKFPPLLEAMEPALLPYLDKPFAFFGHSMGALIGFELARYLHDKHDLSPCHFFVSARRAPQLPEPHPLYNLPEFMFIEELRRLNGTPEAVFKSRELLAILLPILRADFTLCDTYNYQQAPLLSCPITAFGGTKDQKAQRDELDAWRIHTQREFSLHIFHGHHFFINDARSEILKIIAQQLAC